MKNFIYILILVLLISCDPPINRPQTPTPTTPTLDVDSIYTTADFRTYGDYYNTGLKVFAVDLLSEGLEYDTAYHICGTGCNLFLSDIFTNCDSLPAGHYKMDSIAKDMTFLKGMYFEGGNITGTYLLQIKDTAIQRIVLFESGSMDVKYTDQGTHLDFKLYTADSTYYHATYQGPSRYRIKSRK
jgi:hypothetical protein